MLKKLSAIVLIILLSVALGHAAALKPSALPGFTNVSTVQEGAEFDLNVQPDEITWTIATFGNMSTFEVTLDASIDYPCSTAVYYPVGSMTETTTVLAQGVDLTGERCFKGNLRTKTGSGGITGIKINIRGLE
ncbi:unnamed protein product [marine sediment metagenome]|uniref:Uncharacterized protein n=1 Tax=marine sediment metagenome TaxID=412755 RepID=X1BA84_9ZZZZ